MYYKLNEDELYYIKEILKKIPLSYELLGDMIKIDDLIDILLDLNCEFDKFIELCEK